ncbi:MAG: hypothetical protein UT30_C0023G0001 [Candidatus Uhrbacteria bacterium GW2011_GWF2_39_13]|uniref:HTH araC/xylS-type domain-containing protein n=1 Tax=Candidatus Uhrbacteria bacterium GW2011_GWF2_39_13 TaxID=1618995 RepID=A0A0G0MKJ1_9BACT|nr:MAG: hypothetical protein UT30_C0023G0001 [Candidatus Uhrbacteria bacterium GW2011_GWF2_39_13]
MNNLNYSLNFDIVCIGHNYLGKEWDYKNYCQNFIKIYFIKKGKGVIRFYDKEIILEPNRLYIVPPLKAADYFVCKPPLVQYWAHFYAKFENNISLFSLMDFNDFVEPENSQVIFYLFERLYNIYMKSSQFLFFEAEAILRYFLAILRKKPAKNAEKIMRQISRFGPVLSYLEENISEKTTIKKLAYLVHLHPTYFANSFAKVFGMSPLEFMISQKLEKTQKMLFFTEKPIKEIAAEIGFKDEFYFSRIFKKYIGISPTQYRQHKKI